MHIGSLNKWAMRFGYTLPALFTILAAMMTGAACSGPARP